MACRRAPLVPEGKLLDALGGGNKAGIGVCDMCPLKKTQPVTDVIEDIRNETYQLPSIQRLFVWKQDQVLKIVRLIMNWFSSGCNHCLDASGE